MPFQYYGNEHSMWRFECDISEISYKTHQTSYLKLKGSYWARIVRAADDTFYGVTKVTGNCEMIHHTALSTQFQLNNVASD